MPNMTDTERREILFRKLNRVSILISKNASKIAEGHDLTKEDWTEAANLFNECMNLFYP